MRLAILDDYQGVALSVVNWARHLPGIDVVSFTDHVEDASELVARLQPFEVLVAMRERTPLPKRVLEKLPALRLLITTGKRNAVIDVAAANALGVTVSATRGSEGAPAELAWGLILSLARQIPQADAGMRAGRWQESIGVGLHGKTLGVLGLGDLGSQVASIGRAFGMRLAAWSPHLTAERATAQQVRLVPKEQFFETADVISIHLVLSDTTRGLVSEPELRRMRSTAFLINTSRAAIVDEKALLRALTEGWIGGAGIDVYQQEPLPADHPLRFAPRTVLTPHLGYVTLEAYRLFFGDVIEDVQGYLGGAPIRPVLPY